MNTKTDRAEHISFVVEVPGLADAVSAVVPDVKHAGLVKQMRAFASLTGLKLATTRGGDGSCYLSRRKVLSADGAVLHDDHEAWVREQLALDAGHAGTTYARLRDAGLLLSKCEITNLYLVHDKGTENPADFLQADVRLEEEYVDAVAFGKYAWDTPKTLMDLMHLVEGEALPEEKRSRICAPAYRLVKVVDVEAFVAEAERIDAPRRAALRRRSYRLTSSYHAPGEAADEEVKSHDEMFPGWDRMPLKYRRLFEDWARSSAGRSGARLCDHWTMQLSDWTDPRTNDRHLELVPMWTFAQKLAEVDSSKGDVYAHYGKLQTLDRRVKVPFGWYFYMLHGNRVPDGSGKRVLQAAEDGLIVLPEHDYRVLKDWRENSYGF